eukprot:COSAG05_NODE_3812_length_1825_cov_24.267092_2_plen_531_part_00
MDGATSHGGRRRASYVVALPSRAIVSPATSPPRSPERARHVAALHAWLAGIGLEEHTAALEAQGWNLEILRRRGKDRIIRLINHDLAMPKLHREIFLEEWEKFKLVEVHYPLVGEFPEGAVTKELVGSIAQLITGQLQQQTRELMINARGLNESMLNRVASVKGHQLRTIRTAEGVACRLRQMAADQVTLAGAVLSQNELALESMAMLAAQAAQLRQIGSATRATFRTLATAVQGDAQVPRFAVVSLKGGPEWKGAWHDGVKDNLLRQLRGALGVERTYQLHFLCERTLRPVPGVKPYEIQLPSERFHEFVTKAGPVLGATCAVLRLVAAIARPVAKMVGLELPELGLDLGAVREIQLGEATVEEILAGTAVGKQLAVADIASNTLSGGGGDPQAAEADAAVAGGVGSEEWLEFANSAIGSVDAMAEWATLSVREASENGFSGGFSPAATAASATATAADVAKQSMDQICWLVEQACATDVPPRESDVLKKQAIAGLRRTLLVASCTSAHFGITVRPGVRICGLTTSRMC